MDVPRKYVLFIKGDSLDEITEEALHFVYFFLARALLAHRQRGQNGEYETFAVEALALLQKYRHLYAPLRNPPEPSDGDADP